MAKSIKQLQDEVLSFLETKGESKQQFADVTELPAIEQLMVLSAANFILQVQENLNKAGKVDTGTLSSDITSGQVITTGTGYELEIGYPVNSKAAKYYDFVNKGVKGLRSGQPADSPYAFKNEKVSLSMLTALSSWYRRNAAAGKRETQKKNLSAVQRKRKRLLKAVSAETKLKSLAYATAVSIKRKGLKKTGFFDKAIKTSFGKEFVTAVAKIAGREIQINIR